jgi:hypothetical protein
MPDGEPKKAKQNLQNFPQKTLSLRNRPCYSCRKSSRNTSRKQDCHNLSHDILFFIHLQGAPMSRLESILTLGCLGLTSVTAQAVPVASESVAASGWLAAAACSALLVRAVLVWRSRTNVRKARL